MKARQTAVSVFERIGMTADSTSTSQGRVRFGITPGMTGAASAARATIATKFVGHVPAAATTPGAETLRMIRSLQDRVRALEEQLTPRVIIVREASPAEARTELLSYFQAHPGAYPSDAAAELRLDSAIVRDLCRELFDEGLLEPQANGQ